MQNDEIIIDVIPGEGGDVGRIVLNRPKTLNSLTQHMCESIYNCLMQWQEDDSIKAVIIKGEGDRAFCAGGDIRSIYAQKGKDVLDPHPFFSKEYAMNTALHHFPKPYVSFLDGITMGGGIGVSIHGSHRLATENLKFAMPETGIGLYPDIGAGFFLSRAPGKIGYYLALTGKTIGADDALNYGFCTHFVDSKNLDEIEQKIIATPLGKNGKNTLDDLLKPYNKTPDNAQLPKHRDIIDQCFTADSVERILKNLMHAHTDFTIETLTTLNTRSPLSLKTTLKHLERSQFLTFDQVMKEEYILTLNFLKSHDFYEGIRAAIIEKDKKPRWRPQSLASVSDDQVESMFTWQ